MNPSSAQSKHSQGEGQGAQTSHWSMKKVLVTGGSSRGHHAAPSPLDPAPLDALCLEGVAEATGSAMPDVSTHSTLDRVYNFNFYSPEVNEHYTAEHLPFPAFWLYCP